MWANRDGEMENNDLTISELFSYIDYEINLLTKALVFINIKFSNKVAIKIVRNISMVNYHVMIAVSDVFNDDCKKSVFESRLKYLRDVTQVISRLSEEVSNLVKINEVN